MRVFVVAAPGLEELLDAELGEIGVAARSRRPSRGGVECEVTTRQLYAIHRWSRIATRVLLRLARVDRVTRFDALQEVVRSVPWNAYVPDGAPVSLHVASRGSRLHHEGAITERVEGVLARPVRSRSDDDEAPESLGVYVRFDHDRLTVSVDASGELLHRRGWRTESHRSPLRSTIAAAMLRAAGWHGGIALVDPMAGSGTIPIEAASAAMGLPHDRVFAFQQWPSFEPGTWASVRGERRPDELTSSVVAADRDAGAVAMTRTHAAAAGVEHRITVVDGALSTQPWPAAPGMVVTNPPYGRRVGGHDLRDLYAALGRRGAEAGLPLVFLAADDRLAAATGLALEEVFTTSNGGVRVRCLRGIG